MSKKHTKKATVFVNDTGILRRPAVDISGLVGNADTPEEFEAVKQLAAKEAPPSNIEDAARWAEEVLNGHDADPHVFVSADSLRHCCLSLAKLIEAGAPAEQVAKLAYFAGQRSWELALRRFEGAVRHGKTVSVEWRGKWVKVTDQQRLMLKTVGDADTMPLHEFIPAVWPDVAYDEQEAGFNRDTTLQAVRTAFRKLNAKLRDAGISVDFSLRGDNLRVD